MTEALWPYLVVVLAGFLPNEVFRVAGVLLSRGIDEHSEVFRWIRIMATTLLAALVARLLFSPAPALAHVPLALRLGSLAVGILAFYALRRSVALGIVAGEVFFVSAAWWTG